MNKVIELDTDQAEMWLNPITKKINVRYKDVPVFNNEFIQKKSNTDNCPHCGSKL